jgi:hypothetical protein
LNRRPHPYQGCALPTELPGHSSTRPRAAAAATGPRPRAPTGQPARRAAIRPLRLERVMGVEPTPSAWKAEVLPLNYTRVDLDPRPRARDTRRPRGQGLHLWGTSAPDSTVCAEGDSCPPGAACRRVPIRSRRIGRTSAGSHPPPLVWAREDAWLASLTIPRCHVRFWWRGEDSNLRRLSRQIYSLIPLAAREPLPAKPYIVADVP